MRVVAPRLSEVRHLSYHTPPDCFRADDITVTAGSRLITSAGDANWLTTAKVGQVILIGNNDMTGLRTTITAVNSNTQIEIAATPSVAGTNDGNGPTGAAWGTDAGPAVLAAFAEMAGSEKATLIVDGSFLIGSAAVIDFLGGRPSVKLKGLGSSSKITAACPGFVPFGVSNANIVKVSGITFMGVQKVRSQAERVVQLNSNRISIVEDCIFAGTTGESAVVFCYDTIGTVRDSFFGGGGSRGSGSGCIRFYEWNGATVENVQMLDYIGSDGTNFVTTSQSSQKPWIQVDAPRPGTLNRGEVHLKGLYLDEAPEWLIRIHSAAADRVMSVLIEDVIGNVFYGGTGGGIYVQKANRVVMRNVWMGYRTANPNLPGVHLVDAGVAELEYVRCVGTANILTIDATTTAAVLKDCTQTTLTAGCPVTFITSGQGAVARTKAGVISDADFAAAPRPGTMAVNTTGETLAVRMGSAWKVIPVGEPESIIIAVGDETTDLTTGVAKVTFRMPFAMTLTGVRASLTTASTSGLPTFDINEGGVSILSTKLSIDANEKTSVTAATPPVISDTALADDAEITIDIDVAGTGAKGAKVTLIGNRT